MLLVFFFRFKLEEQARYVERLSNVEFRESRVKGRNYYSKSLERFLSKINKNLFKSFLYSVLPEFTCDSLVKIGVAAVC